MRALPKESRLLIQMSGVPRQPTITPFNAYSTLWGKQFFKFLTLCFASLKSSRPTRRSFTKCQGWASVLFKRTGTIFAFFSVLYERTERSLHSFPFFIKEQNILFGFISHTNIANLAKKERKRMQRSF